MLLLISTRRRVHLLATHVSIHLMLLLISCCFLCRCVFLLRFNTSHVTINRAFPQEFWYIKYRFNTSHVTINPGRTGLRCRYAQVSIHLMLLLIIRADGLKMSLCSSFNTSHVTINHAGGCLPFPGKRFQYISCYY